MAEERMATEDELNGLGKRVTDLALECAGCKARTEQRFTNSDLRLESHHVDIVKLFDKMDAVAKAQNRTAGGIAVLIGLVGVLEAVLLHFWK